MSSVGYADRAEPTHTPAVFGRVMALVALTVGFATLGAYLGRNLGGGAWFAAWLLALGALVGLNVASSAGNDGLALLLLFVFGLLLGASVGVTINYYSATDPTAVRQAFGATALFVGALGAGGYAVRKDLSYLYRTLFWLLVGLILAGIVLIFVHMQAAYTVYALAALAIFGLYTIVDFNRLRRAGKEETIPLAAGIFIDIFNVFLLFLRLFARGE